MALKGKDSSGWKDAGAVYGKNASGWQYAKEMWAKDATGWKRAWTDCRKLGAEGGRDWIPTTLPAVYSGSCGNRTYQIPTQYTKDGCPSYTVNGASVSSPDCNSTCFDASTVNCNGCGSATLYTAKAGSGCTSYQVGSCGSWSASTADTLTYSGFTIYYSGTPGYYYNNIYESSCQSCPTGCTAQGSYYAETCSVGGTSISQLSCGPCQNIFGQNC